MNLTYKNKLILIASVLIFVVIAESIFIINKQSTIEAASEELIHKDIAILNLAHELKLSVVQVQQWLTDISATRGQDGLNDGMDVAKTYADQFHRLITELKTLDPDNAERYSAMTPVFNAYFTTGNKMAQTYIDEGPKGGNVMMTSFDKVAEAMGNQVDEFLAERIEAAKINGEKQLSSLESLHTATVFGLLLVLSILGASTLQGRSLLKYLGNDPEQLKKIADNIAQGQFDTDNTSDKNAKGIYKSLIDMRTKIQQQLTKIQQQALESGRIKTALDNVTSPIIMADNEHTIIYANHCAMTLLNQYEKELQQGATHFEAKTIIGYSCLAFFSQSSKLLANLKQHQHTQEITLGFGHLTLSVNSVPVKNTHGDVIGTAIELKNKTNQISIEKEVASIVEAAKNGDLSQRVTEDGKEGFYLELSKGMNDLLSQVDHVFTSLADVLAHMAQGNFKQQMDGNYQGKFKTIKDDVNNTVTKLSDITNQLNHSINSMHDSSLLIAQKNDDLSASAQQQAAGLEQTAAAMEEITSTVQHSTDNAESANQLISDTVSIAKNGESIVAQAIDSMSMINESSSKISEIIGVIDEIAFQTNLLALNASVEAARAGEQGRGFAVVATEVRNLAGRSATAAKEIKTLIEDSVIKVKSGTEFVNKSGASLNDIVTKISDMESLVGDIVGSSKEQLAAINEINSAVSNIDRLTQQNAALAQEVAGASDGMKNQATQAGSVISFFQ